MAVRPQLPRLALYILDPAEGVLHLIPGTVNGRFPAWSPDGTRIVFSRMTLADDGCSGTYPTFLYVIDVTGSGLRQLTREPACPYDTEAAWAPDGSAVAYSSSSDIRVVNIDGSGEHAIAYHNYLFQGRGTRAGALHPSWSPDSRRIVYALRGSNDGNGLWVLNRDGTNATRIFSGSTVDHPAWSPDGSVIAFDASLPPDSGTFDIYTIRPDGTGLRRLTTAPPYNFYAYHVCTDPGAVGNSQPAWEPNGRRVVFMSNRRVATYGTDSGADVFVMNADGSDQRPLTAQPQPALRNDLCRHPPSDYGNAEPNW